MAKVKKRLSKKRKAVLKVLEESKDLGTSRSSAVLRKDKGFKPSSGGSEQSLAHKPRPNKKRG